MLITIRTGKYGSLERALSLANTLFCELEEAEAKSGLPEKVDRTRISELVSETYLRFWSNSPGMLEPTPAMTILFRPVGLHELALIWNPGMREFPPRLPHQPIFCPVASVEYATQIARDWNTKDEGSGFAGYGTKFAVPEFYLGTLEPHTVGSSSHVEYWIPAEQLPAFNASIQGAISVDSAYFGESFKGCVPEKFNFTEEGRCEPICHDVRHVGLQPDGLRLRSIHELQSCVFELLVLGTVRFHSAWNPDGAEGCGYPEDKGSLGFQSH